MVYVGGIRTAIKNIEDDIKDRNFKKLGSDTFDLRNQIAALQNNLKSIKVETGTESSKIVLKQFCDSIVRAFEFFISRGLDASDIMMEAQVGMLIRNLLSVATDFVNAPDVKKMVDTKANLDTTMVSLINSFNKVIEAAKSRTFKLV